MIIRNGFVRNEIGTWINLNAIKYFDMMASSGAGFSIIGILKDIDEEDCAEESGYVHIMDCGSYDEAQNTLDVAFGYAEIDAATKFF